MKKLVKSLISAVLAVGILSGCTYLTTEDELKLAFEKIDLEELSDADNSDTGYIVTDLETKTVFDAYFFDEKNCCFINAVVRKNDKPEEYLEYSEEELESVDVIESKKDDDYLIYYFEQDNDYVCVGNFIVDDSNIEVKVFVNENDGIQDEFYKKVNDFCKEMGIKNPIDICEEIKN